MCPFPRLDIGTEHCSKLLFASVNRNYTSSCYLWANMNSAWPRTIGYADNCNGNAKDQARALYCARSRTVPMSLISLDAAAVAIGIPRETGRD